jgi:peptide deformylase
MILPIRRWPDPVLLIECEPWQGDPAAEQLIADLTDTIKAHRALGLAANQIGISRRVMAIWVQESDEIIIMFNPCVISESAEKYLRNEGCLSFPDVWLDIARPKYVELQWQDASGVITTRQFQDLDAKCVLHELEHLDGRVYTQHVSQAKFLLARKKAVAKQRKKR